MFIYYFAAILSILTAVMSFLMFYDEYERNYTDKRKILIIAFKIAIITFVVFLVLGLLLGFILMYVMRFRGTEYR